MNSAVLGTCSLFEEIGELLRLGVLRAETVANRAGVLSEIYWTLCKPAIEKMRQELGDPGLFEDFEYLRGRVVEVDRERGVSALKQESMRQMLEGEATLGEEPPLPQNASAHAPPNYVLGTQPRA